MRGCSGRRLPPPERVGSRERAGVASTAGRIPELLPSLRGYAEMTGPCTSADAAPETESAVCGSLEVFAPPSVLPKILVRSPNVEFPYLKSLPRDRRSQCPSAVPSFRAARCRARRTHRCSGALSVQAIKSASQTSREGLDRTRIAPFCWHAGAPTRCLLLARGRPTPLFTAGVRAPQPAASLLGCASNANGVARKRGRSVFQIWGSSSSKAIARAVCRAAHESARARASNALGTFRRFAHAPSPTQASRGSPRLAGRASMRSMTLVDVRGSLDRLRYRVRAGICRARWIWADPRGREFFPTGRIAMPLPALSARGGPCRSNGLCSRRDDEDAASTSCIPSRRARRGVSRGALRLRQCDGERPDAAMRLANFSAEDGSSLSMAMTTSQPCLRWPSASVPRSTKGIFATSGLERWHSPTGPG
jgi:hypothetical protein